MWKFKTGKVRGALGETDFNKKVVKIDKKKHRKGSGYKRKTPNKDGSEKMLTTMTHELLHVKHPKKSETAVEKLARAMVAHMSPKRKAKVYGKFN